VTAECDVAIVGAGLVGSALALALTELDLKVQLIEAQSLERAPPTQSDQRAIVLNLVSLRILEALGALRGVALGPVEEILVTRQGEFGSVRLRARHANVSRFGAVASAQALGQALLERIRATPQLTLRDRCQVDAVSVGESDIALSLNADGGSESLSARLLIGADGNASKVRALHQIEVDTLDFDQTALVFSVLPERAHECRAFERFADSGPLALLPRADGRMGVVWCHDAARASALQSVDERALLDQLGRDSGYPLGRFSRMSAPIRYPLKRISAKSTIAPRTLLIGNAAHALHPIGGQGFNLGLRDVAHLRDALLSADDDLGGNRWLDAFAAARAVDHLATVRFTDALALGSRATGFAARAVRGAAMLLLGHPTPARDTLLREAMGFRGALPTLARIDRDT
jgi:2-octaprenyl-6-methoxyphenol hydroxylase